MGFGDHNEEHHSLALYYVTGSQVKGVILKTAGGCGNKNDATDDDFNETWSVEGNKTEPGHSGVDSQLPR